MLCGRIYVFRDKAEVLRALPSVQTQAVAEMNIALDRPKAAVTGAGACLEI
jgi:hypothetical protein